MDRLDTSAEPYYSWRCEEFDLASWQDSPGPGDVRDLTLHVVRTLLVLVISDHFLAYNLTAQR